MKKSLLWCMAAAMIVGGIAGCGKEIRLGAKKANERAACVNGLKILAMGVLMYCDENDGYFPANLDSVSKNQEVGKSCPAGDKKEYVYTPPKVKIHDVKNPDTTPLARCDQHGAVVFADGHAEIRK